MHLMWVAPLGVGGLAGLLIGWAVLRLAAAARELHSEMHSLSQLRPALIELRRLSEQTHQTAVRLRRS